MANGDVSNPLGFIDKRQGRVSVVTYPTVPNNYGSVTALRTRLFAINPTSYSQVRLDKMTENDMIYALRLADDLAGLA